MLMTMIDTHSHLFLEEFADDLPEVMERARQAGVSHIFMPNIDSTTLQPMLDVCRRYEGYCFPMIGLHPTSVRAEDYEDELAVVARELASGRKYVAIGEIGMDLYWDQTFQKEQEDALRRQLDWALDYDLPVVIHCREAFAPIYKIMEDYRSTHLRGVFHSFTGTVDEAQRILEFPGFYLGVNGVVTFKKSHLPELLSSVPLDRILLETDSPYLTPVPYRGRRNESAYVQYVLLKVAEAYRCTPDEVAKQTSESALKVFGMLK